jgi:hypothetical protein
VRRSAVQRPHSGDLCTLEAQARQAAAGYGPRSSSSDHHDHGCTTGETASPTYQRIRPAMKLTDPPTIATPKTYDKKAWESTVRRIRRSRTVVSETW